MLSKQLTSTFENPVEDKLWTNHEKLLNMLIAIANNCTDSLVERAYAIHWCARQQLRVQTFDAGQSHAVDLHPRALVRKIVEQQTVGLILCHGHPHGDSRPSIWDMKTTAQIGVLCRMLEVNLLDHVIFGAEDCFSFRAAGYL